MRKNSFGHKVNKKIHKRGYYIGAIILILLVAAAGIFFFSQNNNKSDKTNKKKAATVSSQKSSTTNVPSSSQDTTKITPSQTPAVSTTQPTPQPKQEVLDNCTYENGPKAGEHCPKDPPASYSQIPACYYSNPSFKDTSPPCPPYDTITSIRGGFESASNNSYCTFFFGAGSLKSYKNVQVSNSGGIGSIPDCSIEKALSS